MYIYKRVYLLSMVLNRGLCMVIILPRGCPVWPMYTLCTVYTLRTSVSSPSNSRTETTQQISDGPVNNRVADLFSAPKKALAIHPKGAPQGNRQGNIIPLYTPNQYPFINNYTFLINILCF